MTSMPEVCCQKGDSVAGEKCPYRSSLGWMCGRSSGSESHKAEKEAGHDSGNAGGVLKCRSGGMT